MTAIIYDPKTESTYVSPIFAVKDGGLMNLKNFPAFFLLIKSKISARRKFTFFIIHKLGSSEILPLASVKDVTLKPSRIFKSRATVKIKTDERNYYFRLVIGADEAYGLILEKIQNNQG